MQSFGGSKRRWRRSPNFIQDVESGMEGPKLQSWTSYPSNFLIFEYWDRYSCELEPGTNIPRLVQFSMLTLFLSQRHGMMPQATIN